MPVFRWIFAAAALAAIPALFLGNAWGHDFDFHVSLWIDAAQQVHQGILFPRWTALANVGFGEPSAIFYPPFSWIAGTILGLTLPWRFVPGVYIFLTLALAGFTMWKLSREWLGPRDALVAALLYAWNPYLLVTAVKRTDYAELLADALFPLLVWAAVRLPRGGRRMIAPLAAIFAAIWLSNLPAGMIASYSLALLLAVQCLLNRSWRPAIHGAAAIALAFGCSSFFLLPAAAERQWVDVGLAFIPAWAPESNYLFTPNINIIMALMNKWLSLIAVVLMAIGLAAAILSRRRRFGDDSPSSGIWYSIVTLGAVSAFVMFRASSIVWKILPDFEYIEYPWRWLMALTTCTMLLAAAAVAGFRRRNIWQLVAVLGAVGCMGAILCTVRWDRGNRQIEKLVADARSGEGYRFAEDRDWRKPRGSHTSHLPDLAPPIAVADKSQDARFAVEQWTAERRIFSVDSARPALLRIKLLNYPAWKAKWNSAGIPTQTDPGTGQMLLETPGGPGRVELYFSRTGDRTAGIAISGISILILMGLAITRRSSDYAAPVIRQ
ncbi:MAG TPA: 6-pyruvoyl-tetrahydropterin synthase-related protein [Bryobacteraceae bacterium]